MAKFLVIAHFNPGQAAHADVKDRGNRSKTWVQQNSQAIESAYTFTSSHPTGGGVAIINANSTGDLQNLLRNNPSSQHLNYEIHELSEYGAGIDQYNAELP